MIVKDRLLFLKYALPCAGTLVRRGNVTQERISDLVGLVSRGEVPEEQAEGMFKVAMAMCASIADRMGRNSIDAQVIRTYFLLEHSEVVDDRYRLMKDFDPVACRTYAGRVVDAAAGRATEETSLGSKTYRTDLSGALKAGDAVVVHWDFVVERPPAEFYEKMRRPAA